MPFCFFSFPFLSFVHLSLLSLNIQYIDYTGMFTDIVSGSNPYEKCDGFQAAPGWDPVTGLGTPIYPLMKKAAFAALK